MTTAFPGALDALANPAGGSTMGSTSPTHSGHHANVNDCIEAIEAKLGIGASTAAANQVLRGTGAGASAFGQVQAGDVAAGALPVKLATTGVLGSTLSVATFSGISAAYAHLEVRIYGRSTAAATDDTVQLRVNNDTGANYWGEIMVAYGVNVAGQEHPTASDHASLGAVPAASSSNPSWFGPLAVSLPGYASPAFHPLVSTSFLIINTTAGSAQSRVHGMVWAGGSAAITRLDIKPASGSWEIGSIVSLYGLP